MLVMDICARSWWFCDGRFEVCDANDGRRRCRTELRYVPSDRPWSGMSVIVSRRRWQLERCRVWPTTQLNKFWWGLIRNSGTHIYNHRLGRSNGDRNCFRHHRSMCTSDDFHNTEGWRANNILESTKMKERRILLQRQVNLCPALLQPFLRLARI